MKKSLLFILIIINITLLLAQKNEDCAAPSKYIMHFLPLSTTVFRCSQDWKNEIQNQNSAVKTVYARTRMHEYCGVAAQYIQLTENGAKATFQMKRDKDNIEIDSTIEDHEFQQPQTVEEKIKLKKLAIDNNYREFNAIDSWTACKHTLKTSFDEKSGKTHAILTSSCKTKIPYELFMNHVLEN